MEAEPGQGLAPARNGMAASAVGFEFSGFRQISMQDIKLGWVVGIIDGEGSVTFDRHGKWRRPGLSVTSTDIDILNELKELLGGAIIKVKERRRKKNGDLFKSAWIWRLNGGRQVLNVLEQIVPFMKCPKKLLRAKYLLANYNQTTPRNGVYSSEAIVKKQLLEEGFWLLT